MKLLFTTVLTCVISLLLWISLSTGQKVCRERNGEEDCCSVSGCSVVTCFGTSNETNSTLISCVLKNETSGVHCPNGQLTNVTECKEPTTPDPTTPTLSPPATQAPGVNCSMHAYNQSNCCATDGQCFFYGCSKDDKNYTYCINSGADATCPDGFVRSNDTCNLATTTSVSSATSINVTQAPSVGDLVTQHFDGASFVGGIVLAVCLMGIAIFGYKFYKSRTERNYHNL